MTLVITDGEFWSWRLCDLIFIILIINKIVLSFIT